MQRRLYECDEGSPEGETYRAPSSSWHHLDDWGEDASEGGDVLSILELTAQLGNFEERGW